MRAQARTLGVEPHLRLEAPTDDMPGAYRRADLVLQLSNKPESFGRTVVEALCSGRPVVGWDHGGVGELLSRYFPPGLVALGDEAALLHATLRVLSLRHLGDDVAVVLTEGGIGTRRIPIDKVQTFTMVRRDGRWQCAAFQNTKKNRFFIRMNRIFDPSR